uniref:DUF5641 domain-containing protein n=1 Tax=Haemonchus placei TaxID=6290 RepID=A0A0N4W499_HAEPC
MNIDDFKTISGPQPLECTDERSPVSTTRDTLLADWKRTVKLVTSFWKRWLQEYVTALLSNRAYQTPFSRKEPPRRGDFVLVHEPRLQRGQWRMGEDSILFATECTPKRIAIARYEQANKSVVVWFPINCRFADVRFDASKPTVPTLCGKKYKCPDSTDSCSFSSSSRTAISEIDLMPSSIKNTTPTYVCSFNYNSSCDPVKRMGVFNQMQLFDDSVLLVEELTITIKDYIDRNDFVCLDR